LIAHPENGLLAAAKEVRSKHSPLSGGTLKSPDWIKTADKPLLISQKGNKVSQSQHDYFLGGIDMAKGKKAATESVPMKELKKAGGRLIGTWKQQAIADNPRASDEELAKIIHEMALIQGYDYTIAPEKVRTLTRPAPKAARTTEEAAPATAPAPKSAPPKSMADGALMDNLSTFVGLVGKDGAKDILENMIDRL
jgi:hypothetical protein